MQSDDIKRLRNLLGCTQEEFAQLLGTTARSVQNWEQGKPITKSKLKIFERLVSKYPDESFTFFRVNDSPGAGLGNEVTGLSSADLNKLIGEMASQRKDFMSQLKKKDEQIDSLIKLLAKDRE